MGIYLKETMNLCNLASQFIKVLMHALQSFRRELSVNNTGYQDVIGQNGAKYMLKKRKRLICTQFLKYVWTNGAMCMLKTHFHWFLCCI